MICAMQPCLPQVSIWRTAQTWLAQWTARMSTSVLNIATTVSKAIKSRR